MARRYALLLGIALLFAAIAASVWVLPHLPDRVPTHWNLSGHVNRYSSRFSAVAVTPAVMLFTWLLMLVLPPISPRGFRLEPAAHAFYAILLAVLAMLLAFHILLLRAQLAASAPSIGLMFALVGVLLVVTGSFVGKLKRNFFAGIRTPWTLANDEVWQRTNRLGGAMLVAGGFLVIAASFFGTAAIAVLVAVVSIVGIVSLVYSYELYSRKEGFHSDAG